MAMQSYAFIVLIILTLTYIPVYKTNNELVQIVMPSSIWNYVSNLKSTSDNLCRLFELKKYLQHFELRLD
jgi:hypothetical protein